MLNAMEHFADVYQHLIAAIGAFSTLAAITVSLALALIAQRSSQTRIKACASAFSKAQKHGARTVLGIYTP
jgi:hypothetical protein